MFIFILVQNRTCQLLSLNFEVIKYTLYHKITIKNQFMNSTCYNEIITLSHHLNSEM